MAPLFVRSKYNDNQLRQYLTLLGYSSNDDVLSDLLAEKKRDPLAALRRLQRRQLAAIPFGNLVLHYSPHHAISLHPEALFTKVIERRLGGYCMENNTFFATVLRSLGYTLYATGARISNAVDDPTADPDGFGGWGHMVIIVTIDSQKYMVDAGFGSQGACSPALMKENEILKNVPSSESRLVNRNIDPNTNPDQRLWILETRDDNDKPWKPCYCFSELEFIPEDFEIMSFRTSQSRESWFTYQLVLTHILLDDALENPVGTLTLSGSEIKKRLEGKSEVLATCSTEGERVNALKEYFGIALTDEEKRGIHGMVTELRIRGI